MRLKRADGSSYYAIGDFGLMSLQQRTGVTILTTAGMGKNSDFYTAPEIVVRLSNASAASDIYSVGCILHDFVGSLSRVPNMEIGDKGPYGDILCFVHQTEPRRRFKNIAILRDALATVQTAPATVLTSTGAKISQYLDRDPATLLESEVEQIIDYIEDDSESLLERRNAFLRIGLAHIDFIKSLSVVKGFSASYCDFVRENSFIFDTCDVIASRISRLISKRKFNNSDRRYYGVALFRYKS